MANEITLLDIPTDKAGPISMNVWKIRYALNYKSLPFRIEWAEWPEIAPKCQKIGAPPTKPYPGVDYTVPAIHDPSTGKSISESLVIATYLDSAYPDTPRIVPAGTVAIQRVFADTHFAKITMPLIHWIFIRAITTFNEPSVAHIRRQREPALNGLTLEEWATPEVSTKGWEELKTGLDWLAGSLQEAEKAGQTGPFFMGEAPTFADFVVAGTFMYLGKVYPEGWAKVRELNDGRAPDEKCPNERAYTPIRLREALKRARMIDAFKRDNWAHTSRCRRSPAGKVPFHALSRPVVPHITPAGLALAADAISHRESRAVRRRLLCAHTHAADHDMYGCALALHAPHSTVQRLSVGILRTRKSGDLGHAQNIRAVSAYNSVIHARQGAQ
ncbi:hypothetical protein BD626DRAFT_631310 [Schizophyllum amplum]|uniref:GST N-terminal domain-containing protein n=1 Tax=Schizophyllum amplum TaxID=97359 RepID=A0A550CBE3_9AGAR|nr:hypothetical protein BD626DRAFT_631310 [Auriculariopsis ampla]